MGFRQFIKKVPVWGRIVMVLVLIVAVGIIGVNMYLARLINGRLRQMVAGSSHGLYKLDYSDLSVNALTGSISLKNVSLTPDSNVFAQLKQHYLAGGKTKKLSLRNVHWLSYLNSKDLSIGKILVDKPEFNVTQYNREDSSKNPLNIYDLLSKEVHDLHIGSFSMNDAVINYQIADTSAQSRTVNKIEHLDLNFTDIRFNKENRLAADDYRLQLKEYKHLTGDSLYWIGIKGFDYNSKKEELKLQSFFVQPRYSDKEFSKKVSTQTVVYNMNLQDIVAKGFDLSVFMDKGRAIVPEMQIGKGLVDVYLDRALPRPGADQVNVCISQKMMNLGVPFMIKLLKLGSINVKYREYETLTDRLAEIGFDQMTGQATNITSIPEFIAKDPMMKVSLNCTFLQSGINAKFEFDLSRPDGSFSSWVKAGQLDAEKLNPILAPVAKIEARQGMLHQMEATVRGNQNGATANVDLKYDGLKIDMLKMESDSLIKKKMASVFANVLIFDDNPKDGMLRTANGVFIRRGFGRSFFNMIWLSVSTGITQILTKKKGLKLG